MKRLQDQGKMHSWSRVPIPCILRNEEERDSTLNPLFLSACAFLKVPFFVLMISYLLTEVMMDSMYLAYSVAGMMIILMSSGGDTDV